MEKLSNFWDVFQKKSSGEEREQESPVRLSVDETVASLKEKCFFLFNIIMYTKHSVSSVLNPKYVPVH